MSEHELDDRLAALVGGVVLIGLTFRGDGEDRQEQLHGLIVGADRTGVQIALEGERDGETYNLPPDPTHFQPARPGEYRLRSTGEVIVDPDYLTTWTVTRDGH